jgi:tetratricopeptide (TPR) repeat protein
MKKVILFFFCCMTYSAVTFAQNPKVDSLLQVLKNTTVDSTRATKMSLIGREMVYGQPKEAFIWLHRSLALAKKSKGVVAASNAFITLADWHYFNGKMDSSYYYTRLAIAHNKKYADKEGLAVAYCSLARYYADNGEYLKSVEKSKEALALFPKTKSSEFLRMGAYIGIGDAYFRMGAYHAALDAYEDSYTIPNALNIDEHHSTTTNSIGQVHFKLKNYKKAMEYTLRSLKMLKNQGNDLGVAISLFNIGEIMFATNRTDSALYYNAKALEMIKDYGYPAGVADCERLYGDIAMQKKEYNKAEKYYASAVSNFAAQGFADRQAAAMISQAKAKTAQAKYNDAEQLLNETLKLLQQKKSLQELSDCYKALRDNAAKKGDFKTAQNYTELYDEAYENYLGEKKIVAAVDSEVKLDLQIKKLQIEKQDLIIQRKNRNNGLLVSGLIILVLGFFVAVYYLRSKAQTEKARAIKEIGELNAALRRAETTLEQTANNEVNTIEEPKIILPETVTLNSATLTLNHIYYIEAQDNYTVFYGKKGEIHREVRTLKSTAELLLSVSDNFKLIQRSYMVNYLYVVSTFRRDRKRWCRLENGQEIPMSDKFQGI